MDLLKKILRQAISLQVPRARVVIGAVPEVIDVRGQANPVPGLTTVTCEELSQLYEFLFPNDRLAIASQKPVRGILNVPNVGKIYLIAQPAAPSSLKMYLPPSGETLCETDWSRLTNLGSAPETNAPSADTNRPNPTTSSAPLMDGPQSPSALLGTEQGTGAAAPSAQPPTGQEPNSGQFGFIPLGLSVSSPVVTSTTQSPKMPDTATKNHPITVASDLATATKTNTSPSDLAPALMGVGLAPATTNATAALPFVTAQMPPTANPLAAVLSPAAIVDRQGTAGSPQEEPEQVDFSADAGGMASKSRGYNPIDPILTDMVKRRASDLHLTGGEPYCFRIDGDIIRMGDGPIDPKLMEQYLAPIMPDRNRKEFLKQNDTDFAYEIVGVGRFRVNVFRDRNGVGSVMRHIPSKILTAEQLNLPPAITKFCELTKGLVLVTGPTGSGKSTTLAAMIDLINKNRSEHILTVEDPIEFVHPQQRCLVNQREVHKHTNSFARALKAALREDPDVVLIGEMRDLETIAIAIETAETGHLVFGTLHTTTAVSTVDRIVDQFPSDRQEQIRMMLASSLRGVVAQTLLKKKGGGRVAAHEILVTNDAVSAMIREGKNHMIGNHMQSQKTDGNQLLNEALSKLVKEGVVDAEDAYRKAVDKASLLEIFRRLNISVASIVPPATAARATPSSGNRSA